MALNESTRDHGTWSSHPRPRSSAFPKLLNDSVKEQTSNSHCATTEDDEHNPTGRQRLSLYHFVPSHSVPRTVSPSVLPKMLSPSRQFLTPFPTSKSFHRLLSYPASVYGPCESLGETPIHRPKGLPAT